MVLYLGGFSKGTMVRSKSNDAVPVSRLMLALVAPTLTPFHANGM